MERTELNGIIRLSLLQLMEETLHSHQGMYTEAGTSLLETLQQLDASQASKHYAGLEATIAGHANHARYYLHNLLDFLQGESDSDFDVPESWRVSAVTEREWSALQSELAATYAEVMRFISQKSDWHAENQLAGAIAAPVTSDALPPAGRRAAGAWPAGSGG